MKKTAERATGEKLDENREKYVSVRGKMRRFQSLRERKDFRRKFMKEKSKTQIQKPLFQLLRDGSCKSMVITLPF